MSLEIKYIDVPNGAQSSAEVSSVGRQAFSVDTDVAQGVSDTPWATLEYGGWVLDGTRAVMDDVPSRVGWWSDTLSGDDGRFLTPPVIEISFPEPYSATGLTFTFSPSTDQWCSEIHVTWLNGQTVLDQRTVYPDGSRWFLANTVESFDKVRIALNATNTPNQFAKVQKIEIGQVVLFEEDEIVSVNTVSDVDPALCLMPVDTSVVEIIDLHGRNLLPQSNQRMEIYQNGNLLETHYINSSIRSGKNRYSIRCQSAVGLLTDDFLGGMYSAVEAKALLQSVLDGVPFELHRSFSNAVISGYLPVCSRRQALQQIAFAIGAVVTTQKSDVIQLLPVQKTVGGVFSPDRVFQGGSARLSPRISKVEVLSHKYSKSSDVETLVDDEYIDGEDVLITFRNPHHSYSITGGTITDSNVNWIKVTAAGNVTVTGEKYNHTSMSHIRKNKYATASERNNVISVEDATLIHSGNVSAALDRLYDSALLRQTVTQGVIVVGEMAGDCVAIPNPWGTQTNGVIASMDHRITRNGHTARIVIHGVEVKMQTVNYYSGELYSGDKEVAY